MAPEDPNEQIGELENGPPAPRKTQWMPLYFQVLEVYRDTTGDEGPHKVITGYFLQRALGIPEGPGSLALGGLGYIMPNLIGFSNLSFHLRERSGRDLSGSMTRRTPTLKLGSMIKLST